MANVLDSIMNIIKSNVFSLKKYNSKFNSSNRMNSTGDALEEFIKDSYADTIMEKDLDIKAKKIGQVFDYTGNNSNPPDAMLSGGNDGDAIEIKKIETFGSKLALNSSFPNCKAYKDSPMINKACKNIPNWDCRDILYVVGYSEKKTSNLKYIFMVYGLDYAADNDLYEGIKQGFKNGIPSLPNLTSQDTNELAHFNSVDPLGITYLRVRGMWGIENPTKLFDKDVPLDYYKNHKNTVVFVVNDEKWKTFKNRKDFMNFVSKTNGLEIKDINIKNPNNPDELKEGKLIIYSK